MFVQADRKPRKPGRPPSPSATAITRTCPRHGETRFHPYRRTDGDVFRCQRCVGEAVTRRHRKIRAILIAEHGGCCGVCGYDREGRNLHFHHVEPETKSFLVNPQSGKSLAAYRAEARKCVLVCANCHGEIEAGLIPCPPKTHQMSTRSTRSDRRAHYAAVRSACVSSRGA